MGQNIMERCPYFRGLKTDGEIILVVKKGVHFVPKLKKRESTNYKPQV